MGDFGVVAGSFTTALRELLPAFRLFKPKGLIHLLPQLEGGYTNVELRAFKDAGESAGIGFVFLSTFERPHTDTELLDVLR